MIDFNKVPNMIQITIPVGSLEYGKSFTKVNGIKKFTVIESVKIYNNSTDESAGNKIRELTTSENTVLCKDDDGDITILDKTKLVNVVISQDELYDDLNDAQY